MQAFRNQALRAAAGSARVPLPRSIARAMSVFKDDYDEHVGQFGSGILFARSERTVLSHRTHLKGS
jgi:hypothetical protein